MSTIFSILVITFSLCISRRKLRHGVLAGTINSVTVDKTVSRKVVSNHGLTKVVARRLLWKHPFCANRRNKWTYEGSLGPKHWHVDYPHCGNKKQSPIDIETSQVEFNDKLPEFDLSHLNNVDNVGMLLENVEGHTVEVHLSGPEMVVTGGGLEGTYGVNQFHFHWGSKDERGSEHTINDIHFPMEMHIVMYSHNYTNFSTALTKPHGLSVLGYFFKVGKLNEKFEKLLQYFDQVEHSEEKYQIPQVFPISSLLPANSKSFYRYDGSLTTPPCYETVVWTLFTEQIEVAEEQLEKFRHLKRTHLGERDKFLIDDFRPIQHRNHRVVTTNDINAIYNGSDRKSSAGLGLLILLLAIFTIYYRLSRSQQRKDK